MSLKRKISSTKWPEIRRKWQVRTVLHTLFRLCFWLSVVWLVWNYALSHFLDAGSVGAIVSFGLGASLYAMSVILNDRKP